MKSFLSQFVAKLDIDGSNVQVGIVTYADTVKTTILLDDHSTVGSLQSAINGLTSFVWTLTNTHLALDEARNNVLVGLAGDRDNVPNLVVVLQDRPSSSVPFLTQVSVQIRRRYNYDSTSNRFWVDFDSKTVRGAR